MGPNGRNCIIQVGDRQSIITKDGVTIAKNVFLKDRLESIGADLVKQIAQRAAAAAGDGTTASVAIAETVFEKGMEALADRNISVV